LTLTYSQLGSAQAERARTGLVPELNAACGEFLLAGQHVGTRTEPGQPLAGSAQPGDRFRPPGRLAEPPAVLQFELGELERQVNATRVIPCILEGLRSPGRIAPSASQRTAEPRRGDPGRCRARLAQRRTDLGECLPGILEISECDERIDLNRPPAVHAQVAERAGTAGTAHRAGGPERLFMIAPRRGQDGACR
jgi:hypothetical protein